MKKFNHAYMQYLFEHEKLVIKGRDCRGQLFSLLIGQHSFLTTSAAVSAQEIKKVSGNTETNIVFLLVRNMIVSLMMLVMHKAVS